LSFCLHRAQARVSAAKNLVLPHKIRLDADERRKRRFFVFISDISVYTALAFGASVCVLL